ncbi:MAG: hypothetical protein HY002_10800 [Candidatus Rokubacteria bacterium]|nr:hypothetical protein [Candidatus Rokubacteria bacterium]
MLGQSVDSRAEIVATGTRPGPLLVVVAVEFEARHLARGLPRPPSASSPAAADGARVALRTVGLGTADLPRLGPGLLALHPRAVLVTGLAGGCAPDVAPGEIVLGVTVGPTGSGEWLAPDLALRERALRALEVTGIPHRLGRILTVREAVATPRAKAECWQTHGALAVDMESAHVLDWARRAGLPALAVRAIADGPADVLPPALLRAVGPAGAVELPAVLGWVVRPGLVGSAWRLWRRSRAALDQLARFLAGFTASQP